MAKRSTGIPTSFDCVTGDAKRFLNGEEGTDVEFKENLNGLNADDLTAFANSKKGGTIFIGVKEVKTGHVRTGQVIGCAVGDRPKQAIISKANSCHPKVQLTVYQEGLKTSTPFFRIDIAPGKDRPYATGSGTYKIRGDGQNVALTPNALLDFFLTIQTTAFVERFRTATKQLQEELQDQLSEINGRMQDFSEMSDRTLDQITGEIQNVVSAVGDAGSRAEDNSTTIDSVYGEVNGLANDIESLHLKLDAVLEHHGIPDPVLEKRRSRVAGKIWKKIVATETKEQIKQWFFYEFPRGTPQHFAECWNEARQLQFKHKQMKARKRR